MAVLQRRPEIRFALPSLDLAGTCLLWLATAFAMAGSRWWLFDLFSHFRIQYCALFAICLLWAVLRRHWMMVVAAGAGVILHGAAIGTALAEQGPKPTAAAMPLRVVSLNVELGNNELDRVAAFLAGTNADVLVLQELPAEKAVLLGGRLPDFPHVYLDAARRRYGAVIMSRWPIGDTETIELAPDGSRAARVELDIAGHHVTVVGVHLHWPLTSKSARLRDAELGGLARLLASTGGTRIVVGDFNVTPWSKHFSRLVERAGMRDCARGHGWDPTWPAGAWLAGIRIDQCLVSPEVHVQDVHTGPAVGSDHYPVIADLMLP